MKKKCELCKMEARTFCESDEASLCWNCDTKVHGANFLVARHTRNLLCRICHVPTPWSASGPDLPRSVCLCHRCSKTPAVNADQEQHANDEEEEVELEEEGEGENQVVPLSSDSPPACSSSLSTTSEEYETGVCGEELEGVQKGSLKRPRQSSANLRSLFFVQKEKGRSGLTRAGERSEADRRVHYWCSSAGTVAKRFRGSCNREECERLDVDSSDNVSRMI